MRLILLLISLFILVLAIQNFAQTSPVSDAANSITIAELRDHIYYLASDELEGRKPGNPGYDKAAEYAASQFRQAGLTPIITTNNGDTTFLQTVSFKQYVWDETNTITITKGQSTKSFNIRENFIILNGKPDSQPELEGEIVFAGAGVREPEYGIDNFAGIDARGKWVVMYMDLPDTLKNFLPKKILDKYSITSEGRKPGIEYARESGAIGVITIPSEPWLNMWSVIAQALSQKVTLKDIKNSDNVAENTIVLANSLLLSALFEGYDFNPLGDGVTLNSFSLVQIPIKVCTRTDLKCAASPI